MSSFWATHEVKSGGGYLTPEEKDALIKSELVFDITNVQLQDAAWAAEDPKSRKLPYGPRYVATLAVPDPATGDNTTRMIGFPKDSGVTSRDDILQAMLDDHFAAGETEPIPAILSKGGNAILLLPAP